MSRLALTLARRPAIEQVTAALLAMTIAAATSTAALAAGPLVNPADETLCLLYYKVAGTPAPLDVFAAKAKAVVNANEFDRPKALAAETARLTRLVASLQQVTSVRIDIQTTFGEYDSSLGEFDLAAFGADEFVPFWCPDHNQLRIRFDNAAFAQSWALDAKSAEAAYKKNMSDRDVLAETTFDLTSVDASSPSDPLSLVGTVRSVKVDGAFNHAPLGHYDVKSN